MPKPARATIPAASTVTVERRCGRGSQARALNMTIRTLAGGGRLGSAPETQAAIGLGASSALIPAIRCRGMEASGPCR